MEDYFIAQVAYSKYMINSITNVSIPNAVIKKDAYAEKQEESQKSYYQGSVETIAMIARDIGKPFGMKPPTAYEELEYAWQLTGKLDGSGRHDAAEALAHKIEKAQKWDNHAIFEIRDLFIHGVISLPGDFINFTQYYGRNGVFPERENVDEREYPYISRWLKARRVNKLSELPMFGAEDIIKGSENMHFGYNALVLRQEALTPGHRKPENCLWTPHYDMDGVCLNLDNDNPDTRFNAENMVTGITVALRRKDFIGVLRPEYVANIDFDALKKDYAAQHAETAEDENDVFDETENDDEDWEDEM